MSASNENPRVLRADLDALNKKVSEVSGLDADGVAGLCEKVAAINETLEKTVAGLNERLARQEKVIAGMKNVVKKLQDRLPLDESPAVTGGDEPEPPAQG